MTRKSVTDEQFGRLHRRLGELARRVDEGSVEFEPTMSSLQLLVEGKRLIQLPLGEPDGHPYRGGKANSDKPLGDFCSVRVNRGPLPPMSVLEEIYSEKGVSWRFDGRYQWEKHPSRQGDADVTDEEVDVFVKHFSEDEIREMGGLLSDNIIAWGLKHGLVPADEKEAHAVGGNPETRDLQRQFWMVALGAFTVDGGNRYVAVLNSYSDGRILFADWYVNEWRASNRFLFVRKASS